MMDPHDFSVLSKINLKDQLPLSYSSFHKVSYLLNTYNQLSVISTTDASGA